LLDHDVANLCASTHGGQKKDTDMAGVVVECSLRRRFGALLI
jgi:hypothetical protein